LVQIGLPIGLTIGLPIGLTIGLPIGLTIGLPIGLTIDSPIGLTIGLSIGLPIGLPINEPSPPAQVQGVSRTFPPLARVQGGLADEEMGAEPASKPATPRKLMKNKPQIGKHNNNTTGEPPRLSQTCFTK